MFSRSTSTFDKLLDKATSNLRLEPDWPTIMQICDLIRQGDCPPKYALAGIKKKLYHQNPHIAMFALLVLESLVKNCGHLIHDEIGTKAYMEQLRELIKTTQHEQVKAKVLEMVQTWAYAFRSSSKYRAVQDTVNIMKADGYKFPALKESDAMFSADTAPEWVDATVCHRCRVSFGVVQRKHHCRACGNVFCNSCSSKTSTIPKFGIEKEVRVCEACFESLNRPRSTSPHSKSDTETLPAEYVSSSLAQQNQAPKPKGKTEEELKEEEELQLALALSQSEAEAKEKEKKRATSAIINNAAAVQNQRTRNTSPPTVKEEEEEDPELARYLNRSYWEQREKSSDKKHSSPDKSRVSPEGPPSAPATPTHKLENGEVSEIELNEFVGFLKSQVDIFVNRMKSNSSRGRSIANDSSVQTLFMNVAANHSKLLKYIHQQDDLRVYYEGLQDKLAQVKDARAALDALRDEYREKLRREAEEAERQKQLQMAQKLQIMRKKKQEYLQYQRQLAIQKIQEQEREMQIRQEQQKQQYLMGNMGMHPPYMPWGGQMGQMDPNMSMGATPYGQFPPPGYIPTYPMQNIPQQVPPPGMQGMPQTTPMPGMPPMQVPPVGQGPPPGMPQMPGPQRVPPGMQPVPPSVLQAPGPQGHAPGMQPTGPQVHPPGMQPTGAQGHPSSMQQSGPQGHLPGMQPSGPQGHPPGMQPTGQQGPGSMVSIQGGGIQGMPQVQQNHAQVMRNPMTGQPQPPYPGMPLPSQQNPQMQQQGTPGMQPPTGGAPLPQYPQQQSTAPPQGQPPASNSTGELISFD